MFVEPTHNPDKNVAAPIAKYGMEDEQKQRLGRDVSTRRVDPGLTIMTILLWCNITPPPFVLQDRNVKRMDPSVRSRGRYVRSSARSTSSWQKQGSRIDLAGQKRTRWKTRKQPDWLDSESVRGRGQ